ncbi:MAG: hypothetical protein ACC645_08515, partial [Pirellulales bacterium]
MTEATRANRLRIHREPEEDTNRGGFGDSYRGAERLCRSFRAVTGWPLRLVNAEQLADDAD